MVSSHDDRPETEAGENEKHENGNIELKKASIDGDNNEEMTVDEEGKENGEENGDGDGDGEGEENGDGDRNEDEDGDGEGDEDGEGEASTSNDDFKQEGAASAKENDLQKGNGVKRKASDDDEVIALDEDDNVEAPPQAKQAKTDLNGKQQASPVPDDPTTHKNMLARPLKVATMFNVNVRKLILDKQLVLPNTISFPPSQVVDLVIEHDPDFPLSKVLTRMFGEERPKHSDTEKKERAYLKQNYAAPHMTRLLTEIGQELVQEATYCDIVHAKNLPEAPKNMETYKQVANQLKPVWEQLRKKNEPFKQKIITCQACNFKTESRLVMTSHRSELHYDGRKFQCGFCGENDTNENRMMKHYLKNHEVVATKPDPPLRHPCYICDEDFQYKGQRDQHMRAVCKRDFAKLRFVMAPKNKEDVSAINTWLWEKPPVDPTILAQQQQNQREQQTKQRLQQQQAAGQLLAAQREQQKKQQAMQILQQQQLLQAQKRLLATQPNIRSSGLGTNPGQSLIAAMQRHLAQVAQQQTQQNRGSSSRLNDAAALFQRNLAQKATATPSPKSAQPSQTKSAMSSSVSTPSTHATLNRNPIPNGAGLATTSQYACEICDQNVQDRDRYLTHLQVFHKQMKGKTVNDMQQGAPLACSRCKERFWTYEGLERHLVMSHGLVTSDLLSKAQRREDGGRCKHCSKQYAFNMLQHLVAEHQVKLCSAEIMYSCDVCSFKCASYQLLETHLSTVHPKNGGMGENDRARTKCLQSNGADADKDDEIVTLD
ncbi:unnamed protein product, partial [Mesorhabditis belari]|uniref:C2H2-type domain-containing protein n=2 Tax=Mesorhabditis belari TaxID=2138241 RepID=A0AAF3FMT8_9BILA